jgi:hypothetical protein
VTGPTVGVETMRRQKNRPYGRRIVFSFPFLWISCDAMNQQIFRRLRLWLTRYPRHLPADSYRFSVPDLVWESFSRLMSLSSCGGDVLWWIVS